MSVPEQTPYKEYTANGSTTSFALGFICDSKNDLIVMVGGIEPPIATWSLVGNNAVFTAAPASGKKIILQRQTKFERTTNFQGTNNSFRPETINKDIDRVWLKLQELGVADWLMKLYVDRLHQEQKEYIDQKDDELKNYLIEEIRKQGVALDQLEDYYNYLMKRLAEIAVSGGWDASFVVDGDKNQHQINEEQKAKNQERISILDFPKTGEYWTETIQAADVYCYNTNKTLYFPNGVYKCDDGIIKRAKWEGEQVCQIGVFPLYDDKVNMVGDKSGLRGTAILFCGAGTKAYTTLRTDKFSSMRYAVLNIGREGEHTSGMMGRGVVDLSIICDFDYKDAAGNITTPLNDNRADYDVGLLMVDSEQSTIFNVCVGGYWKKAGTVHFGHDPDDTHVYDLKTMGNIGLAIIGDGTGTNSGFNGFGCVINSNDHHSRYTGAGEDWGECAFYFDIPSSEMSGSRNGINFYGGTVSTKTNTVGKYDRCGEISWFGTKFENAEQAGSAQASGEKRQIGTANTGSITFFNSRFTTPEQIRGPGKLLETVTNGAVKIIGGSTRDGYEYWKAGVGVRIEGSANQSLVQFTDNPSTTTSGMVIRRTLANVLHFTSDNVDLARFSASGLQFIGMDVSIINVSTAGVTTVNRNWHKLSGGTRDLLTINGGVAGQRLLLNAATNSDQITLKDGTGNLRLNSDFTTTNSQNYIELIFDGTNWCELSRSQNS